MFAANKMYFYNLHKQNRSQTEYDYSVKNHFKGQMQKKCSAFNWNSKATFSIFRHGNERKMKKRDRTTASKKNWTEHCITWTHIAQVCWIQAKTTHKRQKCFRHKCKLKLLRASTQKRTQSIEMNRPQKLCVFSRQWLEHAIFISRRQCATKKHRKVKLKNLR